MAYNMLKEKVRAFLKPFADENRVVGAEDVKKYFEELRGDRATGSSDNMATASSSKDQDQRKDDSSDNRKEQSGKCDLSENIYISIYYIFSFAYIFLL